MKVHSDEVLRTTDLPLAVGSLSSDIGRGRECDTRSVLNVELQHSLQAEPQIPSHTEQVPIAMPGYQQFQGASPPPSGLWDVGYETQYTQTADSEVPDWSELGWEAFPRDGEFGGMYSGLDMLIDHDMGLAGWMDAVAHIEGNRGHGRTGVGR